MPDYQLVLLRHGESEGNKGNVFTGWRDVDLSEDGVHEARRAGRALLHDRFDFDLAYTSLQRRAIRTLWLVCEETQRMWVPMIGDWRLNERHYGALQGMNKAEAVAVFGDKEVKAWRKGFAARPPLADEESPERFLTDPRYAKIPRDLIPRGESLQDVLNRALPVWLEEIAPKIAAGKRVIVTGHGNTLRALAKHIERIDDEAVVDMRLPNGVPRAYAFNADMSLRTARFLEL